jgi:hypothetical protein
LGDFRGVGHGGGPLGWGLAIGSSCKAKPRSPSYVKQNRSRPNRGVGAAQSKTGPVVITLDLR